MNKQEVFSMLRRNGWKGREAITLISDFLVVDWQEALRIYNEEYKPTLPKAKHDKKDNIPKRPYRKKIAFNGEEHGYSEWARILGMPLVTIRNRVEIYGWSVERAFTTPIDTKHGRKKVTNE